MEFLSTFGELCNEKYEFQGVMRNGLSSSSSLVLDSGKGVLVRAAQQGVIKPEKALIALRNHSEAERRRRERINGHFTTLRSLIPGTDKMDKAALLAKVISQVKELRASAAEATKEILVPMDRDELRVEPQVGEFEGALYSIKASLSCEYKHELLSDLRQALDNLSLKTARAEIATLGSRMVSVFVITENEGNIEHDEDTERREFLASSIRQALRSVLDKFYASEELSSRNALSSKRQRVSFLNPSSSSSLGDFC
ncbi:transcription factor bHLH30-like [Ipomoea triloba]|uniref:transcription factor bHLH30-like n=1 Tax=Ipomoea triloba TaxID=35885 RepID=UPI00125D03E9|nr:transcription factor bHLH30-like [Ipomoea triloba]